MLLYERLTAYWSSFAYQIGVPGERDLKKPYDSICVVVYIDVFRIRYGRLVCSVAHTNSFTYV